MTTRNNYRMPAYHRLDMSATLHPKKKSETAKYESYWVFSLYHVYAQREGYTDQYQAVKTYLFTFIPSVSWNFKFW